jgi:hypothetical protein
MPGTAHTAECPKSESFQDAMADFEELEYGITREY